MITAEEVRGKVGIAGERLRVKVGGVKVKVVKTVGEGLLMVGVKGVRGG